VSDQIKYVLLRIIPASLFLGLVQFLFTSVIPKQLGIEVSAGVQAVSNMFFSMSNVFLCLFLARKLSTNFNAAKSEDSADNR